MAEKRLNAVMLCIICGVLAMWVVIGSVLTALSAEVDRSTRVIESRYQLRLIDAERRLSRLEDQEYQRQSHERNATGGQR